MLPPSACGMSCARGDSEREAARVRVAIEAGEEGKYLVQRRQEMHASERSGMPFSERPPASHLADLIFEVFHFLSPKSSQNGGWKTSK